MRLVTGLVKDRLLGCMGQVLQWGLWQGNEPGVGQRGTGHKVSIDKELMAVGRVAKGDRGEQGRRLRSEGSDRRMW